MRKPLEKLLKPMSVGLRGSLMQMTSSMSCQHISQLALLALSILVCGSELSSSIRPLETTGILVEYLLFSERTIGVAESH
jgi:hypothetical protein